VGARAKVTIFDIANSITRLLGTVALGGIAGFLVGICIEKDHKDTSWHNFCSYCVLTIPRNTEYKLI
jgi:hypothetical protein